MSEEVTGSKAATEAATEGEATEEVAGDGVGQAKEFAGGVTENVKEFAGGVAQNAKGLGAKIAGLFKGGK